MDRLVLHLATPIPTASPSPPLIRRSPENLGLSFSPIIKFTHLSFPRLSTSVRSSRAPSPPFASSSPAEILSPVLPSSSSSSSTAACTRWVVTMAKPPAGVGSSREELINYYVETLARVLGSEKDAQMCMYNATWKDNYGFCCDIDEDPAKELAGMAGVTSVRPDKDENSLNEDYTNSFAKQISTDTNSFVPSTLNSTNEYWLVQMEKPGVDVMTKAQMVDYYTQILTKVLGNEQDAQVSIYHISWEKDFGFSCQIDKESARELADVPGVKSVRPDKNFGSDNKDYRGDNTSPQSSGTNRAPEVKTKRLFITGLSFYTSEKTLRAAFEGFGELVEVKIIMDKISKRSKGYAFIEYTTEEAAGAALKEMNGKIINGWMIVVDVARANPNRSGRVRPRPSY